MQQAYRNSRDGIVVLPCYLPWKNGLYKTDALFVVYPSQRGGWSAQCVTDHKTKKSKLPFPQSWAGQPQEVIEQKSGIPGISFCHASRFLITAKDKETALAACRQVLKNNGGYEAARKTPPTSIWCAAPAASCTPVGRTTPPPACRPTRAAKGPATPAPTARGFAYLERCADNAPPCAGKPP